MDQRLVQLLQALGLGFNLSHSCGVVLSLGQFREAQAVGLDLGAYLGGTFFEATQLPRRLCGLSPLDYQPLVLVACGVYGNIDFDLFVARLFERQCARLALTHDGLSIAPLPPKVAAHRPVLPP